MRLEIHFTEFLRIPVGDIPRTHYTHQWKAAQYRRMDRKLATIGWSVLSEDTVIILSLDVLYIIKDRISFLLPYASMSQTWQRRKHQFTTKYLCFFAGSSCFSWASSKDVNSNIISNLFIKSWFRDQQLPQFCLFQ